MVADHEKRAINSPIPPAGVLSLSHLEQDSPDVDET